MGLAAEITDTSEDFPADGNPTRPTSATVLSSNERSRAWPGSPSSAKPGALRAREASAALPQPAAATSGGFKARAGANQVGEQPAVYVQDYGAVGNSDLQVRAGGAVAVVAHPLLA